MTWTRLDDLWTDSPALSDLSYPARWHYLCMIQFCSRTQRYDGVIRKADARRCTDVDEPDATLSELVAADLVEHVDNHVKVGRIDEHIPPPSVREESANARVRKQRSRLHKNGDHSMCLPGRCAQIAVNEETGEVSTTASTRDVTGHVTSDTRTGQDGTGQALSTGVKVEGDSSRDESSDDPFSSEPCFSCGIRPAVNGSDCLECSSGGSDLQHHSVSEPTTRELTETRVSPDADGTADRIAPDSPSDRPATAHRAPTVHTSCAFNACTESARPGKQMCQMHFTREPSSSAA